MVVSLKWPSYREFFHQATRRDPFDYQIRLAESPWPDTLEIPTGMGKTAAVILAWLYKRLQGDPSTPRRLVYCLPMRVLVEQVVGEVQKWLAALDLSHIGVEALLGGQDSESRWTLEPHRETILIGTQDMLLSRALMRGYGMSRYQWPVAFSLLHNDAFWVFDEVQLMGPGLTTSTQLEAFRQNLSPARDTRSLWVSATLNAGWLNSVDFAPKVPALRRFKLLESETQVPSVQQRLKAPKTLQRAQSLLTKDTGGYIKSLAGEVLQKHVPGTQTLVILNTVERAQALRIALEKLNPSFALLLVHGRFRQQERREIDRQLAEAPPPQGRVILATQAIEAGVDLSSKTLLSELAPWASMVQRFGRSNRYGEYSRESPAQIFWLDQDPSLEELARPYEAESLARSRAELTGLVSASPADLPPVLEAAGDSAVLRRQDFLELFNTDGDLSGFDLDISPYIRESSETDLQVFWRPIDAEESDPQACELCRTGLGQMQSYLKKRKDVPVCQWDDLSGQWVRVSHLRPGMTLRLDAAAGGYTAALGFVAESFQAVTPGESSRRRPEGFVEDPHSLAGRAITLADHTGHVAGELENLLRALGLTAAPYAATLRQAALWHDVGKAHGVFARTMQRGGAPEGELWAKAPGSARHDRPYFRHEVASMLTFLANHHSPKQPEEQPEAAADLVAYLILAHHGKARMSLRAMPDETPPPEVNRRFARGVWDGDPMPALTLGELTLPPSTLSLELMELGSGSAGISWQSRTAALLERHGPCQLAWMESLLRIADMRASRQELEVQS